MMSLWKRSCAGEKVFVKGGAVVYWDANDVRKLSRVGALVLAPGARPAISNRLSAYFSHFFFFFFFFFLNRVVLRSAAASEHPTRKCVRSVSFRQVNAAKSASVR